MIEQKDEEEKVEQLYQRNLLIRQIVRKKDHSRDNLQEEEQKSDSMKSVFDTEQQKKENENTVNNQIDEKLV